MCERGTVFISDWHVVDAVYRTLFAPLFTSFSSVVALLLTWRRHAANAANTNNAMVEVLVEPCGQEAIVLDNGCKLNDNPTEHLVRSDRCDLILEQSNLSPIQQFYNGQSIFITGGTGFVGKLLIEKLLRECPGISFIYLLVRPKKGKDMHQRIEEIFDDPVRILIFSPAFFQSFPSSVEFLLSLSLSLFEFFLFSFRANKFRSYDFL